MLSTLLFIFANLALVLGYNLDTKYSIVFDYPLPFDRHKIAPNFGHSVLMNRAWNANNNNGISFLIGAPNADIKYSNTVLKSGAVFKCDWRFPSNRTICRPVEIQFGMNHPTNGMHLGSSLVQRPSISDQYLTCAHSRTYYYRRGSSPEYSLNPTGACYLMQINQPRPIADLSPLNNNEDQFHLTNVFNATKYYYSHAMFGFSASFSLDGARVLSGVPGFDNWNGAMLSVSVMTNLNDKHIYKVTSGGDHYMGYSISVGKFFHNKKECAVLGVPRINLIGSVVFCLIKEETCRSFSEIKGSQIGEYFGSSVLAIDINGDGLDDLVVGAPMYSSLKKGYSDEGRTLVYLSNGKAFSFQTALVGMQKTDARFGTSMANLGDINDDGFNDIVISAPYEDNGKGTIYIYRGSSQGLQSNFTQRISSSDHLTSLNLFGFGYSFSANVDIDDNNFNDLLVGSYLSNKAVLLRSRPIISLPSTIQVSNKLVNLNQACPYLNSSDRNIFPYSPACVTLSYCFNVQNFPNSLQANLSTSLWLDQLNERCFVLVKDNNNAIQIVRFLQNKIVLKRQTEPICSQTFIVLMKEGSKIRNLLEPIQFRLSFNFLENDALKGGNIFHVPMIDNVKNNFTEEIHFELCSKGVESCLSHLKLDAIVLVDNNEVESIENIELIEGSYPNITLLISVNNYADPAYGTKVNLTANIKLSLVSLDHKCQATESDKRTNILCELNSPLSETTSVELIFNPFSSIDTVTFNLNATIITNLDPDSVMSRKIVFNTNKVASVNLSSSDIRPRIQYPEERVKNDVYFSNTLQMQKLNFSSIDLVELYFIYPSSHNGQQLVSEMQITNLHRLVPMKCHPAKDFNFSGLYSDKLNPYQMITNYNQIKSLNLTCSNLNFICKMVKCDIGPLSTNSLSSFHKYSSSLNITLVNNKYRNYEYSQILYHVKVMAKIIDAKLNQNPSIPQTVSNDIYFVFEPILKIPVQPFPIWPLIIGFILGLLLLILIIWLLKKCGFFNRLTKGKEVE